jgi:hypothetical protein
VVSVRKALQQWGGVGNLKPFMQCEYETRADMVDYTPHPDLLMESS